MYGFTLLRWFSVLSLVTLIPVAAGIGMAISHFITWQALQRDALLTAQFIVNCLAVEAAEIGAPSLVPFLDPRVDLAHAGLPPAAIQGARDDAFEHFQALPDALLVSVYAADRTIVWSTNTSLVGTRVTGNEELEQALRSQADVAVHHADTEGERAEQRFVVEPQEFFIEHYVPLAGPDGKVLAVVEVYKEPGHLMASVREGQALVWWTTFAGGAFLYVGVFGIVRRGSRVLADQQRQLVEAQSQVFAGDMARALAHSLRNPLAGVRSSAELLECARDDATRRHAADIVTQVDYVSQWVRELLLYSRPVTGTGEAVELGSVLDGVLASFQPTFERAGIRLQWERKGLGGVRVQGNSALARQALHSVVSNAVENMPEGGELRIALDAVEEGQGLELTVSDTGAAGAPPAGLPRGRPPARQPAFGAGLPMLRRAMERFGGFVALTGGQAGTQVRLRFAAAPAAG